MMNVMHNFVLQCNAWSQHNVQPFSWIHQPPRGLLNWLMNQNCSWIHQRQSGLLLDYWNNLEAGDFFHCLSIMLSPWINGKRKQKKESPEERVKFKNPGQRKDDPLKPWPQKKWNHFVSVHIEGSSIKDRLPFMFCDLVSFSRSQRSNHQGICGAGNSRAVPPMRFPWRAIPWSVVWWALLHACSHEGILKPMGVSTFCLLHLFLSKWDQLYHHQGALKETRQVCFGRVSMCDLWSDHSSDLGMAHSALLVKSHRNGIRYPDCSCETNSMINSGSMWSTPSFHTEE